MQTRHEYLIHELKKLIKQKIEFDAENLARGAASDYANYQRLVGKIEGLGIAMELCDEAGRIVERTI
jgi:hypothetical protein